MTRAWSSACPNRRETGIESRRDRRVRAKGDWPPREAGYLADKRPALGVAVAALAGGTVLLAISPLMVSHLVVACVWAALWGTTDGMASVVQQHRLVTIAPPSAPVLLGLNSSAIYLGVAMGGGLGGLAQDWLSVTVLGVPAAVLALLATIVTVVEGRAAPAEDSPGQPRAFGEATNGLAKR